jgi:hypothetical protein
MNFTFVRAERSQEENQERAFIAASRRKDRDFKQRLESLQKASELHFARTGKRFMVAQSQVTHNGPLIELVDVGKKGRETPQFMQYTLDRSNVGTDDMDRDFLHKDANLSQHQSYRITHTTIPEPSRELWNQNALQGLDHRNYTFNTSLFEASTVPLVDVYGTQKTRDMDAKGNQDLESDELDGSFLDMEYWQGCQDDLDNLDMQGFLDVHFFSRPLLARSDETERVEPESTDGEAAR